MTGVNLTLAGRRFASVLPPPLSRIQEAITAQPLLADASLLALYDVQAYATGDLSQANAFDEVFDFSRAGTADASHFDVTGTMQFVGANIPRFEYDPLTTAPKGLLIEPAQTNLLTYNRALDNAAWTKVRVSVSADTITAPDGTTTADALIENTETAEREYYIDRTYAATSGQQLSLSKFYKDLSGNRLAWLRPAGTPSTGSIVFNPSDPSSALASGTIDDFSLRKGKDDWLRASLTFTTSATGTLFLRTHLREDTGGSGTSSYTGDGTSGIYAWGAQLVTGPYEGSLIKTDATTTTRAADLLKVKPAVVAEVVSATEGTVFVEVTPYLLDYTQNIFTLGAPGGTGSGYRIQLNMSNAGTSQLASVTASGVSAVSTLISPLIGQPNKIAFTYKAGRLSLCLNGATVFENASADIPTSFDEFIIGNTTIANAAAAAHFAKVTYIPRALTDAELQAITT